MKKFNTGAIIACSSGNFSNTAISVIRLSGFQSLEVFQKFFSIDLSSLQPNYLKLCFLKNEDSKVIDQIMCCYLKAPKSFTGENMLELFVHGNTINVDLIINLLINNGLCSLAMPGEFSYRALKNQKLTLSQVEGLDLFLNAASSFHLDEGNSLLYGELKDDFLELQKLYLNYKSHIELSIDFLEDIGEEQSNNLLNESFKMFFNKVEKLYKLSKNKHSLLEPIISILGEPNAGKSTLFNFLLSKDRSIVSSIAGTTRDYIQDSININNIFFKLTDTAGIRETSDTIESLGISRTYTLAKNSLINILVVNPIDGHHASSINDDIEFDFVILTHLDSADFAKASNDFLNTYNFPNIVAFNVLNGPIGAKVLRWEDKLIYNPTTSGPIEPLGIFNDYCFKKFNYCTKDKPILLDRHKTLLDNLYHSLLWYKQKILNQGDIAVISSELNSIGHSISELLGIFSADDVLSNIFSNFCIGK